MIKFMAYVAIFLIGYLIGFGIVVYAYRRRKEGS